MHSNVLARQPDGLFRPGNVNVYCRSLRREQDGGLVGYCSAGVVCRSNAVNVELSKKAVIAAGKIIANVNSSTSERDEAVELVGAWRALHVPPMGFVARDLRGKCSLADSSAFIAQRLKRLESITQKLSRRGRDLPGTNLWNMQDIGGCRAVLASVANLRVLEALYDNDPAIIRWKDYISNPKPSGYRGIHLVVSHSGGDTKMFEGVLTEIQLRSRLQHVWATAVETVGYFTDQSLKSSVGSQKWLRFFSLMGSLVALQEGCPSVPGTPGKSSDLMTELVPYALEARDHIAAYKSTVHQSHIARIHEESDYYLLALDVHKRSWRIQGYREARLEQANKDYATAEASGLNAVLVSTESLDSLHKAYPNYFLDLRRFMRLVYSVTGTQIEGHSDIDDREDLEEWQ